MGGCSRIGIVAQSCRRDGILGISACTNSMNIEDAFSFRQVGIDHSRSSLAKSEVSFLLIWVVRICNGVLVSDMFVSRSL